MQNFDPKTTALVLIDLQKGIIGKTARAALRRGNRGDRQ